MNDRHRSRMTKGLLAGLALLLCPLLACGPRKAPQPETCETHTASLTLSAPETTLAVGDQVTVTATLRNEGCGMVGLLLYRLRVEPQGDQPILELVSPESVNHSRGISAGVSDWAEFRLRAVRPGEARLGATVSYEVHLGPAEGAYWGQSGTGEPVVITVVP